MWEECTLLFFSYLNGAGDIKEATRILQTFYSGDRILGVTLLGATVAIINLGPFLSVIERDFATAFKAWGNENSNPTANRLRLSDRAVIHVWPAMRWDAQPEMEKAVTWSNETP
jgi:hypothetical protein